MAITPCLMKSPANNWAPVTKPLLYALVPMASPFLIPGPESLWQCFGWHVVCSSQRWEMFLKSQLSDHSPAFSSMTDAHSLSDLAGSEMLPEFPWLAPHAPVLKSSVTKLLGLLKSDCPHEQIIPSDTVLSARLNLLTWPWLRALPHVSPVSQLIPGCLVLSGVARSQSLIWADPDNSAISVLSAQKEIFQITNEKLLYCTDSSTQ